jgi:hypothetical protein
LDDDESGNRHVCPILGAEPLGFLAFTEHRFSAQFMRRGREVEPAAMREPAREPTESKTAANNTGAVGGYDAYFGTYDLDAARGTVAVTLEAALTPANIGKTFMREVRVVGDKLIIRLATNAAERVPSRAPSRRPRRARALIELDQPGGPVAPSASSADPDRLCR